MAGPPLVSSHDPPPPNRARQHNLIRTKEYRELNKDNIKESKKKYHDLNREHNLIRMKEYRELNKDNIKESKKKYHDLNRERDLIRMKEYREKKKARIACKYPLS
jgi:hypothetical protein